MLPALFVVSAALAADPVALPASPLLPEWRATVNTQERVGRTLTRAGAYGVAAGATTAGLGLTLMLSDTGSGFEPGAGFYFGIYGLALGGAGVASALPPLTIGPLVRAQGLRRDGLGVSTVPGWVGVGMLSTGCVIELAALSDPASGDELHPVGLSLLTGSLVSAAVQGVLNRHAAHRAPEPSLPDF